MFKSTIVSGFPGIGKTYVFNKARELDLTIMDSDLSAFKWLSEEVINPEFPTNYINYIKENLSTVDIFLVSSDIDMRNALKESKLPYYLYYPDLDSTNKELYLDGLVNPLADFIKLLSDNWTDWIISCKDDTFATKMPIPNAHNNHLINYIAAMVGKEDLLIQSRYITDRKVNPITMARINIKYDDGGYCNEEIKVGDEVTCTLNYDGKLSTYTGVIKCINQYSDNACGFTLDASDIYSSNKVLFHSTKIVFIKHGKPDKIVIPDLPVIEDDPVIPDSGTVE